MSERVTYMSGAWGGELPSGGQPEGQLAELDVEHAATPRRVEAARALFEEAQLSDFQPVGAKGLRWLHRESGVEYVVEQSQVLSDLDPRKSGVRFYVIAGTRLLLMRPRGWDGNVEVGVPGQITGGVLEQSPSGGIQVVDARSGAVVREGLKL